MIQRSIFGLARPKLIYPLPAEPPGQLERVPHSAATLLLRRPEGAPDPLPLEAGRSLATGQEVRLSEAPQDRVVSPVTGTVSGLSRQPGLPDAEEVHVHIETSEEDSWDPAFKEAVESGAYADALDVISGLPGLEALAGFQHAGPRIDTVVVEGLDRDFLAAANQRAVSLYPERIAAALERFREIRPATRFLLAGAPAQSGQAEKIGVEFQAVEPAYPDLLPQKICRKLLGRTVPAGKTCEDAGVLFLGAETVAAVGAAFSAAELPLHTALAVLDRDRAPVHVEVRIGTPLSDVLAHLGIETRSGERLVLDGPMTGHTVYSESTPVVFSTSSLMIQSPEQIIPPADTHCINCGECVRACPAAVPVNMLIRVLENGLYDDAVDQYDLLACIDCGLCSYVCTAHIPVFHYIALGKVEYARARALEGSDAA